MMMRSGDLNLNVQGFGDTAMERLKQTMLQHEFIFRNQVCELHRLYWTQKNLMNEFRMKGFDANAPSISSWLSKDSEEKKNVFSVYSRAKEMKNSVDRNVGSLEEFKGQSSDVFKKYLRDFNLHLPANDFIRGTSKDPEFDHQKKGVSQGNLTVDCGFGEVIVEKSMHHFPSIFSCKGVIDLEDSVGLECHEGLNEVFSGSFGTPMQKSEGIGESCVDACFNHPKKNEGARAMLFDLNIPNEDECSHDLKGILEKEKSNCCPEETPFAPNPAFDTKDMFNTDRGSVSLNAVTISSMELCKQVKDNVDFSIDILRSSSHSEIKRLDSNITSSNSTNLPQTVHRDSVTKHADHEGSEEDTSSSPAAFSNTDDSVTTQLNSPQIEGSVVEKLKPEEGDNAVAAAAEALMDISLGFSAIPIEQTDSFEWMTLQLSEVQSEDHLRRHELLSDNETVRNERGFTLRRGRGFRDFQKEILPGLVTLSRHEICEDLHNVGYKFRRIITSRKARDRRLACAS